MLGVHSDFTLSETRPTSQAGAVWPLSVPAFHRYAHSRSDFFQSVRKPLTSSGAYQALDAVVQLHASGDLSCRSSVSLISRAGPGSLAGLMRGSALVPGALVCQAALGLNHVARSASALHG